MDSVFDTLAQCPVPTIALMNGSAMGGGIGLLFACDMILATDPEHYMQLWEVRRGLVPALISVHIVRAVGVRMAVEWMVSGLPVKASTLYRMGVISAVMGLGSHLNLPQVQTIL
jgi:enoyl-CoA hydratase/carnithine racemase